MEGGVRIRMRPKQYNLQKRGYLRRAFEAEGVFWKAKRLYRFQAEKQHKRGGEEGCGSHGRLGMKVLVMSQATFHLQEAG